MHVIKSLFSAFSMYSKIPVPQVEWKEENRRYALCFFPLIGAVIGGLFLLWYWFCGFIGIKSLLFSVVGAAIPVIVTGGIHLDGFCDVSDARACCGTREKALAVMSDSHIGAFAAINLAVYLLVQTGLFSQVESLNTAIICALGFVQSRAWSGLAAVTFKSAKSEGALQNFAKPAHKNITIAVEIVFLLISSAAMLFTSVISGACAVLCGAMIFLYYRLYSYKKFGGITGDLAGWFLQLCELFIIAGAVLSDVIVRAVL